MNIRAIGFVSAEDAPAGSLIAYPNGTIIMISEYSNVTKDENGSVIGIKRDCYIVGSGEYYCGSRTEKGMLIELDTEFETDEVY